MTGSTSLRSSAFKQVDVFTSEPMRGNALAVVLDADGLADADMQRLAAWTNLSETTFVLPPTQAGASYRLRIFTPRSELPFAGHPSVGSAHALLEAGMITAGATIVQECAAGLLPVRVAGEGLQRRVFVTAPVMRFLPIDDIGVDVANVIGASAVGATPRLVDSGPRWLLCDLGNAGNVRALQPDFAAIAALARRVAGIGVVVFGRAHGADHALVMRAFAPDSGVAEDPVTGSAAAALGFLLRESGELASLGQEFAISQGREIGRDGRIEVRVDLAGGRVEIGGQSVTCIDGTLILPGA